MSMPLNQQVMEFHQRGLSTRCIAEKMGKSPEYVRATLRRKGIRFSKLPEIDKVNQQIASLETRLKILRDRRETILKGDA